MWNEMREAMIAIREFLDGTGDKWAWDDFLSVPTRDPEVGRLQGFCLQLPGDYPPEEKTEYCNKAGMERLRALLIDLERQDRAAPVE